MTGDGDEGGASAPLAWAANRAEPLLCPSRLPLTIGSGMADFTMITVRLATGGAITSSDDVTALKNAGITHVIDCIEGSDDTSLLAGSGMVYLYNGTQDDGQHKPPAWFAASLAFALPALAQPHVKVYAHCAAGVNRGPSTAFCILRALGWTSASAEAVIRAARPQVGLAYKSDADAAIDVLGYG